MPGGAPLLLQRFIEAPAAADPEVIAWLADGFGRWLASDGRPGLPAFLGLHTRPSIVRRAQRDAWLRAAAAEIPGDSPWAIASRLQDALRRFQRSAWPRWKDLPGPPAAATDLQRLLWLALRTGVAMPGTVQGLCNITAEAPNAKPQTAWVACAHAGNCHPSTSREPA